MTDFIDKQGSPPDATRPMLTVEIGRVGWRSGIAVELPGQFTVHQVRDFITGALELAPDRMTDPGDVAEPGFWAILLGFNLTRFGHARVQHHLQRGTRHVVMRVADRQMVGYPDWPLVRMAPTSAWLDLRSERAFGLGPSDAELRRYAHTLGVPEDPAALRRQFDAGVIEWASGDLPRTGWRPLRAAGS